MSFTKLSREDQEQLLDLAQASVAWGVQHGGHLQVAVEAYSERLQQRRACFVTLKIDSQLRGCIGTLEARQPLVANVAAYAHAAAFQDPRFAPVGSEEVDCLQYEISVLSPPELKVFENQQALLESLRPGKDGLILEDGPHRATFLPAVWEQLIEPEQFVTQLKYKAGLPKDHWSKDTRCYIYQTDIIER